jgi:hypothetical protein
METPENYKHLYLVRYYVEVVIVGVQYNIPEFNTYKIETKRFQFKVDYLFFLLSYWREPTKKKKKTIA